MPVFRVTLMVETDKNVTEHELRDFLQEDLTEEDDKCRRKVLGVLGRPILKVGDVEKYE